MPNRANANEIIEDQLDAHILKLEEMLVGHLPCSWP